MNQLVLQPTTVFSQRTYPHFIKYMGSKSKIMDFVVEGINQVYDGGAICDLFAGSGSLAGALGNQAPFVSNDIQVYSSVIADAYLNSWRQPDIPPSEDLLSLAEPLVNQRCNSLPVSFDFSQQGLTREEFIAVEAQHQGFLNEDFDDDWHLFIKNYSGTWWSAEQCAWIDAIRCIASQYQGTPAYSPILVSLMYAMAYTSQGTGHYAQFRDAKTESALKDILIYRKRSLTAYFRKKYSELLAWMPKEPPVFNHKITSKDFSDCLNEFEGGTVYADPPYCFVHYSRFYHALETLVLYDYPNLQVKGGKIVKGRYREQRHQSPFCIRSKVREAFADMFKGVSSSESKLVLSYSNTGMISMEEIGDLVATHLPRMRAEILTTDHHHMTLGRQKDRHREVKECLVLVR